MEISFERAVPDDADDLIAVQNAAFLQDMEEYGECPSFILDRHIMLQKIDFALFYKILVDGRIVGGIEVYDKGDRHYHVYMLCVDPEFQGRGIATEALGFIERAHPDALFWTLVTPQNRPKNRHLYEKAGFVSAGERRKTPELTLIRYEKRIPMSVWRSRHD